MSVFNFEFERAAAAGAIDGLNALSNVASFFEIEEQWRVRIQARQADRTNNPNNHQPHLPPSGVARKRTPAPASPRPSSTETLIVAERPAPGTRDKCCTQRQMPWPRLSRRQFPDASWVSTGRAED